MPTYTSPPELSRDSRTLLLVINDMSGMGRINSIEEVKDDPSAFKSGEVVSLAKLQQHLGWDRARILAAAHELAELGFINELSKN